jgi:hypothetical protein
MAGIMVRKGFRQRAIRYCVFLAIFHVLFFLWAALFGKFDAILSALKILPFSLPAILVLDLLGLGPWMKRSRLRRAIPTLLLVVAIAVILVYGELWAAVPLLVLLTWIIGYVLRQWLSMRRGGQATPPQA